MQIIAPTEVAVCPAEEEKWKTKYDSPPYYMNKYFQKAMVIIREVAWFHVYKGNIIFLFIHILWHLSGLNQLLF